MEAREVRRGTREGDSTEGLDVALQPDLKFGGKAAVVEEEVVMEEKFVSTAERGMRSLLVWNTRDTVGFVVEEHVFMKFPRATEDMMPTDLGIDCGGEVVSLFVTGSLRVTVRRCTMVVVQDS